MKKARSKVIWAVVGAAVLAAGIAVVAALVASKNDRWLLIGKSAGGNRMFLDTSSISVNGNMRVARDFLIVGTPAPYPGTGRIVHSLLTLRWYECRERKFATYTVSSLEGTTPDSSVIKKETDEFPRFEAAESQSIAATLLASVCGAKGQAAPSAP